MDRQRGRDDGFTLIELMIVVLIIAIILAIAVPTFFGAVKRSKDRRAQSLVRNVLTSQLAHWAENQQFSSDLDVLRDNENAVSYAPNIGAIGASPSTVYVTVGNDGGEPNDTIVVGAQADDGRCYWIRMVGDTGLPRFARDDCTGAALVFQEAWSG